MWGYVARRCTSLGAEVQVSLQRHWLPTSLFNGPIPTPTLPQPERRQGGKGFNFISFQLLLFFEYHWPDVRGPKAVPKAGGVGSMMTRCFPGWAVHQRSWGLHGDLVNSQNAPVLSYTPLGH